MDKPVLIQYEINGGGFIYVFFDQTVAYVNTPDDKPEFVTGVPAKIIIELLKEPGKTVSYKDLFKACYCDKEGTLQDIKLTTRDINHIQQQVYKLPENLRKTKINNTSLMEERKAKNKKQKKKDCDFVIQPAGYSLEIVKVTPLYQIRDNTRDALPLKFYHLAGEYVALYPNPQKSKDLLGAFIQICKHDDVLTINAIFDIPSNKALERVLELCPGKSDYSEIIATLHSEIPSINMKSWFTGHLASKEQHIATLMLKSVLANDKRNIILDISDFLKNPDRELIEERDQYRGGLGLVIGGGRTNFGFTAHRIGLIRTSWYNISSMGLDSNELLRHLKATNFINITSDLDSEFYLWILLKNKEPKDSNQRQK